MFRYAAIMAAPRSNPRVYWQAALVVHTGEQSLIKHPPPRGIPSVTCTITHCRKNKEAPQHSKQALAHVVNHTVLGFMQVRLVLREWKYCLQYVRIVSDTKLQTLTAAK